MQVGGNTMSPSTILDTFHSISNGNPWAPHTNVTLSPTLLFMNLRSLPGTSNHGATLERKKKRTNVNSFMKKNGLFAKENVAKAYKVIVF